MRCASAWVPDKLVVAFVAEFSRGKSELINAIFFADTGRRVLPATPGRTTMCPVELGFDPAERPGMALLPIETRLDSVPLAEWRQRPQAWKLIELDPSDAHGLSRAYAVRDQHPLGHTGRSACLGLLERRAPRREPDHRRPRSRGGSCVAPRHDQFLPTPCFGKAWWCWTPRG